MGMRWFPIIVVFTLGMSSPVVLPVWLPGAAEKFGLTAAQSGLVASLELACLAIASIAWATLSRRSRSTLWLVAALGLNLAANIVSYLAVDAATLIAARAVSGLSLGLALADITGRAARAPNPHRVFSFQQLGLIVFVFAFFSTAPKMVAAYGAFTPFLYLAVLNLLGLISLLWLPKREGQPEVAVIPGDPAPARRAPSSAVAMTLAALSLTYLAQSAIWTYLAAAAGNAGVSLEVMGRVLAIGAAFNLLVPIACERIGMRWGRVPPLVVGYAGFGLAVFLLTVGAGTAGFAVGSISLNLLFLTPFLLNTLAALDPSGRSASAAPAFFTMGGAVGPALAGAAISQAGFTFLGIILGCAVLTALVLAVLSAIRVAGPKFVGAPA
jgi:predicted MFS family arabinose efflux permease